MAHPAISCLRCGCFSPAVRGAPLILQRCPANYVCHSRRPISAQRILPLRLASSTSFNMSAPLGPLMRLPVETRRDIWSLIIPETPSIIIGHCYHDNSIRRENIIGSMWSIINEFGSVLHLNHQHREEVLALMRGTITIYGCCMHCLQAWVELANPIHHTWIGQICLQFS